jgi:hypothetical protein
MSGKIALAKAFTAELRTNPKLRIAWFCCLRAYTRENG